MSSLIKDVRLGATLRKFIGVVFITLLCFLFEVLEPSSAFVRAYVINVASASYNSEDGSGGVEEDLLFLSSDQHDIAPYVRVCKSRAHRNTFKITVEHSAIPGRSIQKTTVSPNLVRQGTAILFPEFLKIEFNLRPPITG